MIDNTLGMGTETKATCKHCKKKIKHSEVVFYSGVTHQPYCSAGCMSAEEEATETPQQESAEIAAGQS